MFADNRRSELDNRKYKMVVLDAQLQVVIADKNSNLEWKKMLWLPSWRKLAEMVSFTRDNGQVLSFQQQAVDHTTDLSALKLLAGWLGLNILTPND